MTLPAVGVTIISRTNARLIKQAMQRLLHTVGAQYFDVLLFQHIINAIVPLAIFDAMSKNVKSAIYYSISLK